jgi:hypothetical protein
VPLESGADEESAGGTLNPKFQLAGRGGSMRVGREPWMVRHEYYRTLWNLTAASMSSVSVRQWHCCQCERIDNRKAVADAARHGRLIESEQFPGASLNQRTDDRLHGQINAPPNQGVPAFWSNGARRRLGNAAQLALYLRTLHHRGGCSRVDHRCRFRLGIRDLARPQ